MKNQKMLLNELILGELKDGKVNTNDLTVRFDKEVLNDLQQKLDDKICLTFLEFFTLADIIGLDIDIKLTIRNKHLEFNIYEVMVPTNEMDWFINHYNPLFVNSSSLTMPELTRVVTELKIEIAKN